MTFPNALATTELAAVNQILGAVGQAPVTTLDQVNPDTVIAYETLQECTRDIQSEGWSFNRENGYPLTPDANTGHISIPDNALSIDLTDDYLGATNQVVQREGKLYNKTTHSFDWSDYETVECDMVWLFDWTDLPSPFRDLITARACVAAVMKMTGDTTALQILQQREVFARASCMEYECNQGDYNFLGIPKYGAYTTYQPFHALAR